MQINEEKITKKLTVLEKADELAHQIYITSKTFPEDEFFGITLQLRKTALHVPVQILEAVNRQDRKELKKSLHKAMGKITEMKYLLRFCFRMKYLSESAYQDLNKLHIETDSLLWRFYNAF